MTGVEIYQFINQTNVTIWKYFLKKEINRIFYFNFLYKNFNVFSLNG